MEVDIITTSWGYVALALSENGVYAVSLPHDNPNDALKVINFELNPQKSELFCQTAELLKKYFSGENVNFSKLPLDLSWASPFSRRVYQELLKVPFGATITYRELAVKAGNPRAARAVGRAMATNKISVIIP